MLIDSHCHLDFPDLAGRLPDVLARARAAGVGRDGDDLDPCRAAARPTARSPRRTREVYCTVGTHPHNAAPSRTCRAGARSRPVAPSALHRHRRGGPRLFLRQEPARRAAARLPRPYRRGARDRAAARHPRPRRRRGHDRDPHGGDGARALRRRPALLLVGPGAGRGRRRTRVLRVLLRHHHLQEVRRTAPRLRPPVPRDRLLVETDAPYLAPEPHRGRNERAGLRGAHRPGARRASSASREDEVARITTANFYRLFRKAAAADARAAGSPPHDAAGHDPRLRLLRRRAARRRRLGRLRPGEPEEPTPALLDPRRAARAAGGDHASSSTPRRTCASSCSAPTSGASTRCCSPTTMPTTPTASTTCGRSSSPCAGACRSTWTAATGERADDALRLLLRDAARQRLPADPRRARAMAAGSEVTDRGPRRRASTARAVPDDAWRHRGARLPLRRRSPMRPT